MLGGLEKVEVWELQERVAKNISALSKDHGMPYQTRKELEGVGARLKNHFEEVEELQEIRDMLYKISEDRSGLLTREQRGEIYSSVCLIEDFVTDLKGKK